MDKDIIVALLAFAGGLAVPITVWLVNRARQTVDIAAVHAATARTTTETALELVTALRDDNARLRARNVLLRALLTEHGVEVPDDAASASPCQSYGRVREDGERQAHRQRTGNELDDDD